MRNLNNTGSWQHVTVVYHKNGTVTGYLNCNKSLSERSAFDFRGVKAGLGSPFLGHHGTPFVGAIDELKVYDRALRSEEVKTQYSEDLFRQAELNTPARALAVSVPAKSLASQAFHRTGKIRQLVTLSGEWVFNADPESQGNTQQYFAVDHDAKDWRPVSIPCGFDDCFAEPKRYFGHRLVPPLVHRARVDEGTARLPAL